MLASSCEAAISAANTRHKYRRPVEAGFGAIRSVNRVCVFGRSTPSETTPSDSKDQHLLFVVSRFAQDKIFRSGCNRGVSCLGQRFGLLSHPGCNYESRKSLFRPAEETSKTSDHRCCGFEHAEVGEREGHDDSVAAYKGFEKHVEIKNETAVLEGCTKPENGATKISEARGSEDTDNTIQAKDIPQGTLLGAIALITGTSVGAGILALPARTGPAGFIPSAAVLGVSWSFLVLEALVMAEMNVGLMLELQKSEERGREIVSLRTMAEETLGRWGGNLVAGTYLFLSYTLMVAYIVKAEDVMSALLQMPTETAALVFSFVLGNLLLFGGSKLTDWVNQMLTFGLLGSFIILVVGGASFGDWTKLERMDWLAAPATIPVVFLALVFHDLIPFLCVYLGGDMARIRVCILVGSVVPLLMLLIWDGVALSISPVTGIGDPLDALMRSGDARAGLLVQLFALLAVATSFIGTYVGMFEFFREQLAGWLLNTPKQAALVARFGQLTSPVAQRRDLIAWFRKAAETCSRSWTSRLLSFVMVLAPPLAISLVVPTSAFLSASDIAGAYGMTALYGIFPPLMAWSFVSKRNGGLVEGKAALAGLGVCATGVILLQLAGDISYLLEGPSVDIVVAAGQDNNPVVLCAYTNSEE